MGTLNYKCTWTALNTVTRAGDGGPRGERRRGGRPVKTCGVQREALSQFGMRFGYGLEGSDGEARGLFRRPEACPNWQAKKEGCWKGFGKIWEDLGMDSMLFKGHSRPYVKAAVTLSSLLAALSRWASALASSAEISRKKCSSLVYYIPEARRRVYMLLDRRGEAKNSMYTS